VGRGGKGKTKGAQQTDTQPNGKEKERADKNGKAGEIPTNGSTH